MKQLFIILVNHFRRGERSFAPTFAPIFSIIALLALLIITLPAQAQGETGDLFGRVNNLRASLGLAPYALNGALSAAAQQQAQWMVDTGSISHTRPDGSSPRTRTQNAGYGSSDVSENIYGGTNATTGDAWVFWVNSPIHYRGLTNTRYTEIGVGAAHSSWGAAYVLVFGNPGGVLPVNINPRAGSGNLGASGPPQQPSYVLGVDENGYILHEIQPGDTLGDIALIYGYTWDDIPYMMEINHITDNRTLEIGSVFLVPPYDGTYTPTPGNPTETPLPTTAPTDVPPTHTPEITATPGTVISDTPAPSLTPSLVPPIGATSATFPEDILLLPTTAPRDNQLISPASATPPEAAAAVTEAPTEVAAAATPAPLAQTVNQRNNGPSSALIAALVVQIGILVGAGFEFLRRLRRS